MPTAEIPGKTPHISPLLRKARHYGFVSADDLLQLAVNRGCGHYAMPKTNAAAIAGPGSDSFCDEEIAIALISAASDGGPQHIRCAAQLPARLG